LGYLSQLSIDGSLKDKMFATESLPRSVECLVLFGSQARKQADEGSDVDIAVFARVNSLDQLTLVKGEICKDIKSEKVNVSAYSTATAELMAREGSLFLWHLRCEGKILASRSTWFTTLVKDLMPYTSRKAKLDLDTFSQVTDDIIASLSFQGITILFEAATLFAVMRSMGMILTTLKGRPCFGRLEPILYLKDSMGYSFPLTEGELQLLLHAKLCYSRKASDLPTPNLRECLIMAKKVKEINQYLEGVCNETI